MFNLLQSSTLYWGRGGENRTILPFPPNYEVQHFPGNEAETLVVVCTLFIEKYHVCQQDLEVVPMHSAY